MRRFIAIAALAVITACAASTAHGADQPLRIYYGYTAGGVGDNLARTIAEKIQGTLGRSVVVENRTGADGRLSVMATRSSPPNGDFILFTPMGAMALYPLTFKKLDYDPFNDFTPISQVAVTDFAFGVASTSPQQTLGALIDFVRANPDKANAGNPGLGSTAHFVTVALNAQANLQIVAVPFRGSANAIGDVLGGTVLIAAVPTNDIVQHVKSGRMRALAVSGATRSPFLPDVPTFREAGYPIEGTSAYSFYAPARTPPQIVDQFSQAIVAAVRLPEVKQRFADFGLTLTGTTPAELAAIHKADYERWAPVVKASGFTADQ